MPRWRETQARRLLAEVALDGLPKRAVVKATPLLADFVETYWSDIARYWKPSTAKCNLYHWRGNLAPVFGHMRVADITKSDVTRWRDDCSGDREAVYNRAIPVLASLFKYSEALHLRRKGSNPCRGMPRYKRQACERYLSPLEFRRIGAALREAEKDHPSEVAIIRLNDGALVFNRSDAVAFTGIVSGNGTLSQIGAGTLTLSGANSYAGGTTVSAGTLAVSADANLGAPGGGLTLDGGTLHTMAAFSTARAVTLGAAGGIIDNGGNTAQFSGVIAGAGALAIRGAGTVTLAADNSYVGGTTINSGTLQIGGGGTNGSILGDVSNNGTLMFNRSDNVVFSGRSPRPATARSR